MAIKELETKLMELQELKRMAEELNAEIEAAQDEIKAEMGEREELVAGAFKVTYKSVSSSRLDTKALTEFLGKDALQPFYKTSTIRRFIVK